MIRTRRQSFTVTRSPIALRLGARPKLPRAVWRVGIRSGLRESGTRREHSVDRREMASRIGQHFSVGGMIGILNGDDGAAQPRVLAAQIGSELLLGLRGSDHQNFMYAFERVRDLVKKMLIGGRLVTAVRALAAVYALMLVVSMDHGVRLLGR